MDSREHAILATIGRNIRVARARCGQTQEGAARLSGLHTTQVARMERGEVRYGATKLVLLAWALESSPADLFEGLDQP